jgi:hypothetical protein
MTCRSAFSCRTSGTIALALLCAPILDIRTQQLDRGRLGLTQPLSGMQNSVPPATRFAEAEKSYWREGGLVTALAAVIALNIMENAGGDSGGRASTGERLLYSALTGVVFFVPGALIGGLIPKK